MPVMEWSCRTTTQQDHMNGAAEWFRESHCPAAGAIARTLTAETPTTFWAATDHLVQQICFLRWVLPCVKIPINQFSKCLVHECQCNNLPSFCLCPLSSWQPQGFPGRTAFPAACFAQSSPTRHLCNRAKSIRYLSFATSLAISTLTSSTIFYVRKVCHPIHSLPLNSQK